MQRVPSELSIEQWLVGAETGTVVDCRSESEHRKGHVPGAVNLPLLNDAGRHEVGCLYKSSGRSAAVALGLELLAERADHFFENLRDLAKAKRPCFFYCARGGMRSGAVAAAAASLGVRSFTLRRGYKSYRNHVLELMQQFSQHPLVVLNGLTGSGKTLVVREALALGLPAVDFEGLANHRGSAFGAIGIAAPSPSQQMFENLVAGAYRRHKHAPCLLVEIENSIGPVHLLKPLRQNIVRSPMIEISRQFDRRVAAIAEDYAGYWGDGSDADFEHAMGMVRRFLAGSEVASIVSAVREKKFAIAIEVLLKARYDRSYKKSLDRHSGQFVARFDYDVDHSALLDFLRDYLSSASSASRVV